MRFISTQLDITILSSCSSLMSHQSFLQNYFNQLREAIGDTQDTLFTLDRHGPIIILEAGDNLFDLSFVGLRREDRGLLGSMPEYVEVYNLGDIQIYKIVVMHTNDYMVTFFTQVGIHDEEVEQWLKEMAE
ncbi:hypothetical protein [Paenibacillus sp. FSL R10-2736]|uniref:hypothetical protein n=1 Tax=Paenibacillus sp. FSL R10-2736 TaxID=2954692 RepID=UPI0030F519A1